MKRLLTLLIAALAALPLQAQLRTKNYAQELVDQLTARTPGLLVATVMILLDNIPSAVPIVSHGASWAALPGRLSLALVIGVACFGFYAARAGQPMLGQVDG